MTLIGLRTVFYNPQFQPNFNRVRVWDIMWLTCTDWARNGNMAAFRSECRLKKTTLILGMKEEYILSILLVMDRENVCASKGASLSFHTIPTQSDLQP